MALSPTVYQILCGIFAALGSFLYGYDLGVIGGAVASDSFVGTFNPNPNEVGAVVSVFTGGAFFGAFFAGPLGDFLGRRLSISVGAIVFVLGGCLQAGGRNLGYLYAGRAIAGLGIGCLVMIVPLYQAEIAHPRIRGRITGMVQFMLGIGALIAVWVVYGTNKGIAGTDNNQWRIPLGLQVIPAGILGLLIPLFPESPRWLISHGKEEQGLRMLARLHARGDTQDFFVQNEFAQIKSSIEHDREHEAKGYRELFTDKSAFRRLFIAVALQASVQMTGVSAIQYFTPEIYKTINIGTSESLKYQGISNALSIVAQFCTMLFIDRIGRRWPVIICNLVNCLCFIVVTAVIAKFPNASPSGQNSLGWTFIVFNWIYQVSFSFGCGPLSWIVPAEIFNTKTRSKGVSIATMVSFAFNTMIGQITSPAITSVGWRYFLTFVVCNFTNAIFFYCFLPETAKLPLETMNHLFTSTGWFVPGTNTKALRQEAQLSNEVNEDKLGSVDHREEKA